MEAQRRVFRGQFRSHNHLIRDIVDELKELREKEGYTQADFAEFIGRSQSSISRFENFESYPRFDVIRDYAIALGHRVEMNLVASGPTDESYPYTLKPNYTVKPASSTTVRWKGSEAKFA